MPNKQRPGICKNKIKSMIKKILKSAGYILLLILVYIALQICFTFITMVAAMAYTIYKGYFPIESFKDLGKYEILLSSPATNNIYVWAISIALCLSALTMLLFLYFIKGYRLRKKIFNAISSKSLFHSTMLVFSSMLALNILVQWFGLEDKQEALLGDLSHNIIGVITISLLAPLLEEVLFRGAIQGYMMRRYTPWTGIICAALTFGIFHMNPAQSVYATLIGIIFGWIYYRTGNLLSVIVGHVLNNSMATLSLQLFPESDTLPIPDNTIDPMMQTTSEIFAFMLFATLSIFFAIKLHRLQPPAPSPWRDITDAV